MKVKSIHTWGFSMYGGYYVNVWQEDESGAARWGGYHFDKLRDLRAWAKERGLKLDPSRREDN